MGTTSSIMNDDDVRDAHYAGYGVTIQEAIVSLSRLLHYEGHEGVRRDLSPENRDVYFVYNGNDEKLPVRFITTNNTIKAFILM